MTGRLLLTVTEAAGLLSISRGSAYRMAASGELPTVRVRGMLRVPVGALERWIEAGAPGPYGLPAGALTSEHA